MRNMRRMFRASVHRCCLLNFRSQSGAGLPAPPRSWRSTVL
uniref:Uncharacterized protein n=1 Tax=Anguilla anguilla TaxID=7936 RepID=A0A0E9WNC9_ANGAN